MKLRRIICFWLSIVICLAMFTGCGNTVSFVQADLSYTQCHMGTISLPPDVQVVGLGEASHGVAE